VPSRRDLFADLAAQYIAATLGVTPEPWDVSKRQGAHDLRYEYQGRSVAVEVKRVVSEDFRQMEGELDKLPYQRDDRLRRSWHVLLRHDANIGCARERVPSLLMLLEDAGWVDVWEIWRLRSSQPRLAGGFDALGVSDLWGNEPTEKHPPGFRLTPAPWSAFEPDIDALPAFASERYAATVRR
jgi:hypothetical protein